MTDQTANANQTSVQPPPPKARSWRWLKITLGLVISAIFLLRLLASLASPDLELERIGALLGDDGKALRVTNTGHSPITIKNLVINERGDCTISAGPKFVPVTLNVGDNTLVFSKCRIIRAEVETDQGSSTYSFNR